MTIGLHLVFKMTACTVQRWYLDVITNDVCILIYGKEAWEWFVFVKEVGDDSKDRL